MTDAYRQLYTLSEVSTGNSWYQVGYSCRQSLVRFANEVFDLSFVADGVDQPQGDNASDKLKWTLRHHLRLAGAGDRYRESQESIVDANWKFVSNVGHRQETANGADAKLAVIYTYLTVWMVDSALQQGADPGD